MTLAPPQCTCTGALGKRPALRNGHCPLHGLIAKMREMGHERFRQRLAEVMADIVFEMTDEEIEVEMRERGEDPEKVAEEMRARLQKLLDNTERGAT